VEGLQLSKCTTLGALKDDRSNIKASWACRELSLTRSGKVCAPIIPRRIKDRATKEGCAKQNSLLKLQPFEGPKNVVISLCVFMCDELALIDIQRQSYFGALFDDFLYVSINHALRVSKGDIVKVSEVQAGFQGRQRRVKGVAKKQRTNRIPLLRVLF